VSLPVVLVLALVLAHPRQHDKTPKSTGTVGQRALGPVRVPAPPPNPAADAVCTKLLNTLPPTLDGLPPRPALSSSTDVAAWGEPPLVLRCGVGRPTALRPGSADLDIVINGVTWLPVLTLSKNVTVWTTVDRPAYVEVTVPLSYEQPPLGAVSDAIAKTQPAVCVAQSSPGQPAPNPKYLCVNRK
jgi:hypothetical protein